MAAESSDRNDFEIARHSWEAREEDRRASWNHTLQFGVAALRAPIIIHSGGIAAFLGFVSANSTDIAWSGVAIGWVFWCFVFGLVAAALSTASAYGTQGLYTSHFSHFEKLRTAPYIKFEERDSALRWGIFLHALTIVLVAGSYVLFVVGAWMFLGMIEASVGLLS